MTSQPRLLYLLPTSRNQSSSSPGWTSPGLLVSVQYGLLLLKGLMLSVFCVLLCWRRGQVSGLTGVGLLCRVCRVIYDNHIFSFKWVCLLSMQQAKVKTQIPNSREIANYHKTRHLKHPAKKEGNPTEALVGVSKRQSPWQSHLPLGEASTEEQGNKQGRYRYHQINRGS